MIDPLEFKMFKVEFEAVPPFVFDKTKYEHKIN